MRPGTKTDRSTNQVTAEIYLLKHVKDVIWKASVTAHLVDGSS